MTARVTFECTTKINGKSNTKVSDPVKVSSEDMDVEFETFPDDVPGPDKPHNKNISHVRLGEETYYQEFTKVVSHVYDNSVVDMAKYLKGYNDPKTKDIFHNELKWVVNGSEQDSYMLSLGRQIDGLEFNDYRIEVMWKNETTPRDRIIITVISYDTKNTYTQWYANEADMGWLAELPAMYPYIIEAGDPEPSECDPDLWLAPEVKNTRFHPNAFFEMRAHETAGGHGHQATYDDQGHRINEGVSAGSADKSAASTVLSGSPDVFWPLSHVYDDVDPFIRAAQLDGNPIAQDGMTLTAPLLHEGFYLKEYLERRPTIANNRPEPQPNHCAP